MHFETYMFADCPHSGSLIFFKVYIKEVTKSVLLKVNSSFSDLYRIPVLISG